MSKTIVSVIDTSSKRHSIILVEMRNDLDALVLAKSLVKGDGRVITLRDFDGNVLYAATSVKH